jgi:two-component system, chemotaxis family, protein-glutamate methylesterase/glutaminase
MAVQHATKYEALVIGVSAGGIKALPVVLAPLPADLPLTVVIVQHLSPDTDNKFLVHHLGQQVSLKVQEAGEREPLQPGIAYVAPANYHLLIEQGKTFALSIDERVNYSRPSIDVLFESAAQAYHKALIGMILTGASSDGAAGLRKIKEHGGLTIVQDPATAESGFMPAAAIRLCQVDLIAPLGEIPKAILEALG